MSRLNPEKLQIESGDENNYEYRKKIGEGAFSEVFKGKRKNDNATVVLKKLKNPRPKSVNREIMVLNHLKNSSKHIVNMIDAVRNFDNKSALLVYDYVAAKSFMKIAWDLDLKGVKYYLYQLAVAIDESHKRGIMHRDIKMTNTIVDEKNKLLILIDWGLGEFYEPGRRYNCRVGTRFYKAPELIL